jgi:hypothetical protein
MHGLSFGGEGSPAIGHPLGGGESRRPQAVSKPQASSPKPQAPCRNVLPTSGLEILRPRIVPCIVPGHRPGHLEPAGVAGKEIHADSRSAGRDFAG